MWLWSRPFCPTLRLCGWTALMHAARNGDHNLVRALLHRGCDRSPLNSSSQTAFDIAKFWGHTHIFSVSGPVSGPQSPHEMFFSAEPLDRLSIKRPDQDWIRTRQKDPRTVYLLFHKLSPMTQGGEESGPVGTQSNYIVFTTDDITTFYSPIICNTEVTFVQMCSDLDQEELLKRSKDKTCSFPKNPHRDLLRLSEEEAGLVAQSRSVLAWHARYSFCSTCGGRSRVEEAGHKRSCENTTCVSHQGVHNTCYPRVDPVVIMLVLHPDQNHCLLGRKKVFPPGMFSCLAGFIEPGECVEAAVRREVQEESGVLVDPVWYVCSQPWPMPSSLMIGCLTIAVTTEITVDQDEIEEAKWFSRQQVIDSLIGGSRAAFVVPPRQTIAHQLLRHWTGLTSNL
uniref:NAD(+) diphosphatase n=1 Tax=Periophthalmus magnuspinnatus TaxID=409849 RepID=A0A3B4AD42_9GOBI